MSKNDNKKDKYKNRLITEILNIYEDYYMYSYEELIDAYFHLQDRELNYVKKLRNKLVKDNLSDMKHYFL